MLRFRNALVASLFIFGLAGGVSSWYFTQAKVKASDGRSWTIASGSSDARLDRSGRLAVSEKFGVDFKGGTFRGFYRDIPLGPAQTSSVGAVGDSANSVFKSGGSALLGSYGAPGLFGTTVLAEGRRIVWHIDATGHDALSATYSIDPVGDRYSDADFLDVSIWGDQWGSFTKSVNGSLVLPTPLPAGEKVAVSPAWLGVKPLISPDRTTVSVAARDVPAHEGIRVKIRLPKGWLPGKVIIQPGNAPSLPSAGPFESLLRATSRNPVVRFVAWALLLLLIGEVPIIGWLRWNKRRLRDGEWAAPGTVYEPPAGRSLVYGHVAADETGPSSGTALVATLMDLIARGFYARDNVRDEKSGDWRLQIALPTVERTQAVYSDGEQAVLDFVDSLLADGPCVVDDLDGRVVPAVHKAAFQEMQGRLQADGRDFSSQWKSSNLWVKTVAVLWLVLSMFVVSWLTSPLKTTPGFFLIAPIVFGLALGSWQMRCWPVGDFVRTPPAMAEIQGGWRGWRDFILHFDQMETAPDLGVILWERAFAGALMWGVAREFVNRTKVLVPDLDQSSLAFGNSAYFSVALGDSISHTAVPSS
ncbi:MAG: DUF2207 domain-containing protein, partial [Actinomycetes bacterium]